MNSAMPCGWLLPPACDSSSYQIMIGYRNHAPGDGAGRRSSAAAAKAPSPSITGDAAAAAEVPPIFDDRASLPGVRPTRLNGVHLLGNTQRWQILVAD